MLPKECQKEYGSANHAKENFQEELFILKDKNGKIQMFFLQ